MTREEEIKQAVTAEFDKTNKAVNLNLSFIQRTIFNSGFYAGVEWADEHPRNPWRIFPKDIPNDGQEVILTWEKSGVILKALFQKEFVTSRGKLVKNIFRLEHEEYKGLYSNERWHDESSVTFWMPIPETPNN